jgi:iron complex transport system permease protein
MSARVSWRAVIVVVSLLAGAVVIAIGSVGIGKYTVAPADVLGVLMGTNTSFDRVVVLEWRMPRMLMALLIGAVLRRVRRDLSGVDPGGGYCAVAAGALVGGLVTAVVVYVRS